MDFYGIDAKGSIIIERVTALPSWTSDDTGRLLINTTTGRVYLGGNSSWMEVFTDTNIAYIDADMLNLDYVPSNYTKSDVTLAGHLTGIDNALGNINIVPTGTILSFAGEDVPVGFLECNGLEISRTTYSNLFAVIGEKWGNGDAASTFNVPDLRGVFLRGWSHENEWNTGNISEPNAAFKDDDRATRISYPGMSGSTGDAVGSYQEDANKLHTHVLTGGWWNTTTGTTIATGGGINGTSINPATSSSGGNESRPINAYVMYIIKT